MQRPTLSGLTACASAAGEGPAPAEFYGPLSLTGHQGETEPAWTAPGSCMRVLGRSPRPC